MECRRRAIAGPGLHRSALGADALITPLAVHLFFPVIPAVKVALGLQRRLRATHLQHLAVRHGLRHAVLRLAVGSLRPAAGAAVGAGAVPGRQRGFGFRADARTTLVLGRLVQAIGAGCALTLVRAIARDAFRAEQLVKAIAYLTMFGTLGPMISPIIGGVLTDTLGWRSVFGFALVAGGAITLIAYLVMVETHPAANRKIGE